VKEIAKDTARGVKDKARGTGHEALGKTGKTEKPSMVPPLAAINVSLLAVYVNAAQWWLCATTERARQALDHRASLRGEGEEKKGEDRVPRVMAPVTRENPKKARTVPPLAATSDFFLAVHAIAAQWWLCATTERARLALDHRASLRGEEEEKKGEDRVPRVMAPVTQRSQNKSPMVPPLAATGDFFLVVHVNAAQWWLCETTERARQALDHRATLRGEGEEKKGEDRVPRVMAPLLIGRAYEDNGLTDTLIERLPTNIGSVFIDDAASLRAIGDFDLSIVNVFGDTNVYCYRLTTGALTVVSDLTPTSTNIGAELFITDLIVYKGQPCLADFNNDGILDFFDIIGFVGAFSAGCE